MGNELEHMNISVEVRVDANVAGLTDREHGQKTDQYIAPYAKSRQDKNIIKLKVYNVLCYKFYFNLQCVLKILKIQFHYFFLPNILCVCFKIYLAECGKQYRH